jgi:hypothetical protein
MPSSVRWTSLAPSVLTDFDPATSGRMAMQVNQGYQPSDFSTNLFWDVDPATLDMDRHRKYIFARVLERGTFFDIDERGSLAGEVLRLARPSRTALCYSDDTPLERIDDRSFRLPAVKGRQLIRIPGYFK